MKIIKYIALNYWTSCKSLKLLTTETLSHGVYFNFSQCLGDSVVQKRFNKILRLLIQEVYYIKLTLFA
jgi:hypothetical protein